MTPEQLDHINATAKGDLWVIGRELVEIINEQEAEIARLNAQVAELEDAVPARITAETERDDFATKLASALTTVTALTQTIRAYPDAVANSAANLAHARAERDRSREIIQRVTAQMEDYAEHGSRTVNVRQVLNLLSPTWPDGNYASAPSGDLR